jgi:rRNA processing protein Krr1/Pno1
MRLARTKSLAANLIKRQKKQDPLSECSKALNVLKLISQGFSNS